MKPDLIKRFWKIACAALLLCRFAAAQNNALTEAIRSTRHSYAPDPRLAVFDVSYRESAGGVIVLQGEVDNPRAKAALLAAVRNVTTNAVCDSIIVLPDTTVTAANYGIVILSVGNVRSKPGEKEELVSQVLLGTTIRLLKKKEGYYFVQLPDHYLGWLNRLSFVGVDEAGADAWGSAHKVIVLDYFGIVHERPAAESAPVCDVVMGCVLKDGGRRGGWRQVELADGRKGFIRDTSVEDFELWKSRCKPTGDNIEATSKKLIGIPYLWGGTSVKGVDCSGFTKTVYLMNGIELLRDASQQATMGVGIEAGKDFENLQKGDLIFFNRNAGEHDLRRITHVAIYLGNRFFIHSSGRVRIGSFEPASPYFEPSLLARYACARRLF